MKFGNTVRPYQSLILGLSYICDSSYFMNGPLVHEWPTWTKQSQDSMTVLCQSLQILNLKYVRCCPFSPIYLGIFLTYIPWCAAEQDLYISPQYSFKFLLNLMECGVLHICQAVKIEQWA